MGRLLKFAGEVDGWDEAVGGSWTQWPVHWMIGSGTVRNVSHTVVKLLVFDRGDSRGRIVRRCHRMILLDDGLKLLGEVTE